VVEMGCVEVTLDRWIVERIIAFERIFCRGNPFALCVGYSVRWNEDLRAEVKALILYSEDGEPKIESVDVQEVLSLAAIDLDPNHSDIKGETFINPGIHLNKIGDAR
jgi:hypothetical protein